MEFAIEDFKSGLWLLLKNARQNLTGADMQDFSAYAEDELRILKAEFEAYDRILAEHRITEADLMGWDL